MLSFLLLFRKDLRRFLPEILFAQLVLVGFVWVYPYTWVPHEELPYSPFGIMVAHDGLGALPALFLSLIPITWLVLIGRVVQSESLVGNRQYWVTRPIPWPTLLAEKLSFTTLFLVLPFLLALLFVLHRAGFSVLPLLPRTALLAAFDALAFVLPLFVLATLTRTFFRLFLTIVAILVAITGLVAASETISPGASAFTPYDDRLSFPLFVITLFAVILVQYSSRTVWLARSLLAISLSVILVIAINPLEGALLESFFYPPALPQQVPATLSISANPDRPITLATSTGDPSIDIPIDVSDVPFGFIVQPEDVRLTTRSRGAGGVSTNWQAVYNRSYTVTTKYGTVSLQIPKAMLRQMRAGPVDLDLQLALAVQEVGSKTLLKVPPSNLLAVPGLGICALDPDLSRSPGLTCRVALRQPPAFVMSAPWTTHACTPASPPEEETAILSAQPGTPNPTPIDVALTSVLVSAESFSLRASTDVSLNDLPPLHLCPGSSIALQPLTLRRRARLHLTLPHFVLPERNR